MSMVHNEEISLRVEEDEVEGEAVSSESSDESEAPRADITTTDDET